MNADALLLVFIGCIIGGIVGCRISNVPAWRGAVITLVGVASSGLIQYLFNSSNGILGFVLFILGLGISGGALKLGSKEMTTIATGALLFGIVSAVIADSVLA